MQEPPSKEPLEHEVQKVALSMQLRHGYLQLSQMLVVRLEKYEEGQELMF